MVNTLTNINTSAQAAANFEVIYIDPDGVVTTLPSASYTLFLNSPVTGAIWGSGGTLTYPTVGSPIPDGSQLIINRIVPLTQLTSISNQGNFYPQAIEIAIDTLCFEIQEVANRTGQFRGTWATGVGYNIGDIVIDGAAGLNTENYYMCIVQNTSGTWSTDLTNGNWVLFIDIQGINQAVTDAEAAATAAALSAAAASTSATNASSSASAAATSATNASNSASAASSSASTASTQASNAAGSASSASTSATNASNSASAASGSASSASTSASSASTSASSASTSATNASNSAAAAAASAILAGTALTATSTSSLLIATGSKTFTTQANKNFFAGQFISAASNANSGNYMHGQVSSYSGTTLIINVTDIGGSGTYADWNIAVSGTQGSAGSGAVSNVSVATANGFSGNVTNPTTTPDITLSTTINGILSGAGGALSATPVTGTGDVVLRNSPALVTPDIGTPSSGILTNCTGTAAGLVAGTVITNANLTGPVISSGNNTTISNNVVTEVMQLISDNTTHNVSTSAHGYAPKGDGSTTKFLNANGAYSTPGGGNLVQYQYFITSSPATGTTTIPYDNTKPQNTEGDQYFTINITPTNSLNTLEFTVWATFAHNAGGVITGAVFINSTVDAIFTFNEQIDNVNDPYNMCFKFYMIAATTSVTTFNVRFGSSGAGTFTLNGVGGAGKLDSSLSSGISINELAA